MNIYKSLPGETGEILTVVEGRAHHVSHSKPSALLIEEPLNQIRLAKEAMDFMTFCVQHDEWEHSLNVLRQTLSTTDRV